LSEDLTDWLARHNSGHSKSNKRAVPWRLVHSETFANRSDAVSRERFLKTGKGRDELHRILSQTPVERPAQPGQRSPGRLAPIFSPSRQKIE